MPTPAPPRRPSASLGARFPELRQPVGALVDTIRAGLPTERVDALSESLAMPAARLTRLLGIPTSTLARRRVSGRLGQGESERALRLARLVERATDVFGSLDAGREWLLAPQVALGDALPLVFADTEPGADEVMRLLGRIEHGVAL